MKGCTPSSHHTPPWITSARAGPLCILLLPSVLLILPTHATFRCCPPSGSGRYQGVQATRSLVIRQVVGLGLQRRPWTAWWQR